MPEASRNSDSTANAVMVKHMTAIDFPPEIMLSVSVSDVSDSPFFSVYCADLLFFRKGDSISASMRFAETADSVMMMPAAGVL